MAKLLRFLKPISKIVLPKIIMVGLDIQDRHIGFVASANKNNGSQNLVSGIQVLAEDAVENGEIKNISSAIEGIRAVKQSLIFSKLKEEAVFILSLPPEHIYTETLSFPLMSAAALKEAIALKIETSLPWPANEAYVDWKKINLDDPKKMGVFIAGVKKSVLDGYMSIFRKENIHVAANEFHVLSLARLLEISPRGAFIFVLVDEDGLELAIFREREMVMHHLKPATSGEQIENTMLFELRRLIVYAETELYLKINQVFIFDYTEAARQYADVHNSLNEVRVDLFTPKGIDPKLFIAAGASMRKFETDESGINLLPAGSGGSYHEVLVLRTFNLWANIALMFFGVFALAGLIFYVFLNGQNKILSDENRPIAANVETKLSSYGEQIKDANNFNQLANGLATAAGSRKPVGTILDAIQGIAAAQNISILQISFPDKNSPIGLKIFSPSQDDFLKFISALKADPAVKDATYPLSDISPANNLLVNVTITF